MHTAYQQATSSSRRERRSKARRELLKRVQQEGIALVRDLQPLPEKLAAEAFADHRESVVAEYCGDEAKAKRHRDRCDALRRVGRDLRRDAPPSTSRKPQAARTPRGRTRAAKGSRSHRSRRRVSSSSADSGGGEPHPAELVVRFDGASTRSGASYGIVTESPDGRVLDSYGVSIGHGTCNTAEWRGLLGALREAKKRGAKNVQFVGDSQLVVRQATGAWKVKSRHLKPLYEEASRLLGEFESAQVCWIPRDLNKRADRAAEAALRNSDNL